MGLNCGLIGLPSCGKTTIFNAITSAGASSFGGAETHKSVVNVPDARMQKLADIYQPAKMVFATLEVVDIPGLKAGSTQGEGWGSKLLGHVKDMDALLHVVRCFEDKNIPFEYDSINPQRDIETVDLELIVADTYTLKNKINRLSRRAKAGDKEIAAEVADCEKVLAGLEDGVPARKQQLSESELASIQECHLVSLKPVLYIANIKTPGDRGNEHARTVGEIATSEGFESLAVCGRDEAEINLLEPEEREEFLQELGLGESSMVRLINAGSDLLGLLTFFTAGPKEVHAWTCRKGDNAPTAAGKIHSDMEKGFIRMEVIKFDDLVELGSEAAVSKAGKLHVVSRDYQVQDGDIVVVRFSQ